MAGLIEWAVGHSADFLDLESHAAAMFADHPTAVGNLQIITWLFRHRADETALYADVTKILSDFPGFTLAAHPDAETLGDELATALQAKHAGDPHALAAIDIGGIVAAFQKWLPILLELWNQFFKPKPAA